MSETKKLGKVYEKALQEAYTKAREALEAYEKVLQDVLKARRGVTDAIECPNDR